MSSSNSFNICPRCGNSNMLNAKYCSRCGGELKLPEEPIICHNCRTRNTPMANFCRNCGAELKVGYATKICTRCGNEVPAEQSVCTCGYSFAHTAYAMPASVRADGTVDTTGVTATGADAAKGNGAAMDKKAKKEQKKQAKLAKKESEKNKVYSHKGGRAFAIVAMVLLLLFAYIVVAPFGLRPGFLANFDKGITGFNSATGEADATVHNAFYGYNMIMMFVSAITGGQFGATFANNGGTVQAVIAVLVAIFILAAVAHFIVCLVRAIRPRRSRKPNWLYLALAALTTIAVGLIVVFNMVPVSGFWEKIAAIFKLADSWSLGYVLYVIPAYFWFFFLYSLIAKARALKEQTVAPATEQQAE